ncbi:RNA-binding protein, putative [Plasmodium chabaudi chabaudi]|uniref:RNA-binding protein, putative n=1 Tax=Plasmodium chabaudi chabaudi TaxID=31271 RepID=A0A1D3RYN5_PLACU|nr:RNA-binding protein, putative [Plasmodium chabaudi chabaudi]
MNNTNKVNGEYEIKEGNNANSTKTLWVGDLDKIKDEKVDENYILYCMFYEFSEDIIKIKLCKEKNSQKNSYAFIEFTSYDIAKYCFEQLNGKWIPGKINKFKLNWAKYNLADNVNSNDKNLDIELDDKGTYSIYVGSLPKSTTKEEIENLFSSFYSSICFVKIIKNTQKNQNKVYCFIHFFNYDECVRALTEMDGYIFKGYKIKVSKSNGIKIANSDMNNYYNNNKNFENNTNNIKLLNANNYNPNNFNQNNYFINPYNQANYSPNNYNAINYNAMNYNSINYNSINNTSNNYHQNRYPTGNNTQNGYNSNNPNMLINPRGEQENECNGNANPINGNNNNNNTNMNENVPPNKNMFLYYNNGNSELNNPYDINYYDQMNSNVNSYGTYGNTANSNSNNNSIPYNTNNYSGSLNQLNYYSNQMTQMNNYNEGALNNNKAYNDDGVVMNNHNSTNNNTNNNNDDNNNNNMHNYAEDHTYLNNYMCDNNNLDNFNMDLKNENNDEQNSLSNQK